MTKPGPIPRTSKSIMKLFQKRLKNPKNSSRSLTNYQISYDEKTLFHNPYAKISFRTSPSLTKNSITLPLPNLSSNSHSTFTYANFTFTLSFYSITTWSMKLKDIKYSILPLSNSSPIEVPNKLNLPTFPLSKPNLTPKIRISLKGKKLERPSWRESTHPRPSKKA